jgi:hypothetical protein
MIQAAIPGEQKCQRLKEIGRLQTRQRMLLEGDCVLQGLGDLGPFLAQQEPFFLTRVDRCEQFERVELLVIVWPDRSAGAAA